MVLIIIGREKCTFQQFTDCYTISGNSNDTPVWSTPAERAERGRGRQTHTHTHTPAGWAFVDNQSLDVEVWFTLKLISNGHVNNYVEFHYLTKSREVICISKGQNKCSVTEAKNSLGVSGCSKYTAPLAWLAGSSFALSVRVWIRSPPRWFTTILDGNTF